MATEGSCVVIDNSLIEGCTGDLGGGLEADLDSNVTVANTVFSGNTGAYMYSAGAALVYNGSFTNCIFYDNFPGALAGRGLVDSCFFLNNLAGGGTGASGVFDVRDSVFFRGGFGACDGSSVSRSTFTQSAGVGGTGTTSFTDVIFADTGFACEGSEMTGGEFDGCDYVDGVASLKNVTVSGVVYGIGAENGCEAEVSGSVVWGNSAAEIWGDTTVTYSLVEGGYAGEGNISSDPLFVGNPVYSGTWSDVYVDEGLFQTELTDETASWEPGELAGLFVRPELGDPNVFTQVIADNDATHIWAWGHNFDFVDVGGSYEIIDLHLQSGSPAIDSGYGLGASNLDVEGNPRYDDPSASNVYDCASDAGPDCVEYVDMGAYEYQP
jgi:hypothetical protein